MGVTLHTTPYGPTADAALHGAVAAAKAGDPLAPVTVVVPSNSVGVAARRLLAGGALGPVAGAGRGLAAVTFLTPYRLAELLGAASLAAEGRRPVSTPVLTAALRRAFRADPGLFAPVAHHPATEEALVGAFRELAHVPAAARAAVAARSPRAADVVRLCEQARRILAPAWYDEADLVARATLEVHRRGAAAFGTVVVHLPERLAAGTAELLLALGEHGDLTVVAALTGDERADAEVRAGLGRLGLTVPPVQPVAPPVAPVEITSATDAEDEVRAVVRHVFDALGDGIAADRIAVLYGSPDPYGRTLLEHLVAAGVPVNGAAVRPVSERAAGRTLLRALRLPGERYARPAVLSLLAGAPVLAGGRPAPAAVWERLSRRAGVVRDLHEWQTRLADLATRARADASAEAEAPDPRPWLVERLQRDATHADELRTWVLELAAQLQPPEPATWPALAGWAGTLLRRLLGGEARRERWPDPERRSAERVEAALDRLAGLEGVAEPPTPDEFARTLEAELLDDLGRVGRMGEGVLVGPLSFGVGLDVDVVVVVGVAEGLLPARVVDDGLLPDQEREAAGPHLPRRADGPHRQHRQLVAACAAARRRVVCTLPRGDLRRTTELAPSRWLQELAPDRCPGDAGWHVVPSFAAGVRTAAFPPTEQEYRLRALAGVDPAALPAHPQVADDPALRAAVRLVQARRRPQFSRFDGNLSGCDVPTPIGGFTSATALEAYAGCPHRYLFEHLLRVHVPEEPEELLTISPLERGSLIHGVLEEFLTEAVASNAVPAPGHPWPPEAAARLAEIAEAACRTAEARGVTGFALLWQRERSRILADLRRLLVVDDERRARLGATPIAAELSFGRRAGDPPPVTVTLPDGGTVQFVGSADRVDATASGGLVVIDYKTGRADAALDPDDPTAAGTRLQLPVYALAARQSHGTPTTPVEAGYWFATTRGSFAWRGHAVTPQVLEEFGRVVEVLVSSIGAGLFPARPPDGSWNTRASCPFCDPDGLGVADVARRWSTLRGAPELRGLVALLEPEPSGAS